MPGNIKGASITQMAVRILENTSQELPWTRKAELLSKLSLRMKLSGYNARYRESIFNSALKHWERRQHQDETGERPLHRDRDWNKEESRREKEKKVACWYKTGENR